MFGIVFFINSIALGAGLAMDAFSVSLANGLNDPGMSGSRKSIIAGTFAGFQFAMPLIGWICVRTIASYFEAFEKAIPWIALILLLFIGGKMLIEGVREDICRRACDKCENRFCEKHNIETDIEGSAGNTRTDLNGNLDDRQAHKCRFDRPAEEAVTLSAGALIIQGIATSIDALSVGFTISDYVALQAVISCLIIGIVTFVICIAGLFIGAKAGTRLGWKASVLGGVILIAIGIEIFVTGI